MSDGFDCTQCGAYANPTVYRPGTPERLRMEATRKCRDCSAGDVLGTDDELPGILDSWDAQERLTAWRDAAVARHLSEASAVHPAVHTPARVGRWLESHGWERKNVSDLVVAWRRDKDHGGGGWVYQPVNPGTVDYAQRVIEVVSKAAWADGVPNAPVLLEIAQQSDEVAW